MYIQNITNRDPELWLFPTVYRALEDHQLSPEQFLNVLLDDLRLVSDPNAQSISLAESGDIALASLIAHGSVDAIESTDFKFTSDLQIWKDLIQSTLDELRDRFTTNRADLPVDLIGDIEVQTAIAVSWIEKHRYDRAATTLTDCDKTLMAGIEKIKKDRQTTRDRGNEMFGRARNYYQERAPLLAGVEADSLAVS